MRVCIVKGWFIYALITLGHAEVDKLPKIVNIKSKVTSTLQCFQCLQQLCPNSVDGPKACRDDLGVSNYLQEHFQFPKTTCPTDPALWGNPDLDSPAVRTCPELGSQCGKKGVKITVVKHYLTVNSTNSSNSGVHQPFPILPAPSTSSKYNFVYALHTCVPPKIRDDFCSQNFYSGRSINKTVEGGHVLLQYQVQMIKKNCSLCGSNNCNRGHPEQAGDFESDSSPCISGSVVMTAVSFLIFTRVWHVIA